MSLVGLQNLSLMGSDGHLVAAVGVPEPGDWLVKWLFSASSMVELVGSLENMGKQSEGGALRR